MKKFCLILSSILFSLIHFSYGTTLVGTYSINPALSATTTNFQNFSSAITYLTSSGTRSDGGPSNSSPFGVSGAVTFQIASGTYSITNAINIPPISGASATNTITFDGSSALLCSLTGNIDSSSILGLNQCNYITVSNLTITNISSSNCAGITIVGNSSSNSAGKTCSIKNCIINLPNIHYPKLGYGILISSTNLVYGWDPYATMAGADSIEIDNNNIVGGSTGIYFNGGNSASYNKGLVLKRNIINVFETGIFIQFVLNNVDILSNKISILKNGSPFSVGIYFLFCFNNSGYPHKIIGNKTSNAGAVGIYLEQSGSNNAYPTKIYNNMICGGFSYSTYNYGIFINMPGSNYSSEVLHNTVYMDFAAGTVYGLYHNSSGGINTKNNIFICDINSARGAVYPAYFINSPPGNSINYNIYYNTVNSNIIYRGTTYTNSTFLSSSAGGDSSYNLLPLFRNKFDLNLANICTPKGVNLTNVVSFDIDSNVRSVSPNIGCDELIADSNDISLMQLLSPVFPITSGSQNLRVKITNNGLNTVTSFNVSYNLNSGSSINQLWTGTLNPCDTISILFSGSQQINLINGINNIKIYTSLPNGVNDRYLFNDTIIQEFSTPLSGNYVIGSAPSDFSTITAAASALTSRGISGSLTFNIKSGIYNESIALGNVAGSSATQVITFKSQANNRDSVIINSTSYYALRFINSSYLNIKSLSVNLNLSGMSNTYVVSIEGTSSYDTIENCRLYRPIFNQYSLIEPSISAQTANIGLVFRNNLILGGSIYLRGISSSIRMTNTVFENNILKNSWRPIDIVFQDGLTFRNNILRLNVSGPVGASDIFFRDLNNSLIANNVITNDSGVSVPNITLLNYSINTTPIPMNSVYIYNNSIHTVSSGGYVRILQSPGNTSNVRVLNNIFSHKHPLSDTSNNGTYHIAFNTLPVTSAVRLDYNNYYSTSNALIKINTTNYPNVTAWKLASHADTNSLSYRPGFTSNLDLTPNPNDSASWSLNGRATHLSLVPRDINDSLRPQNKQSGVPDIGAYEFTPLVEPPFAKATPAVPSAGTTQHFTFGEDTVARIKWNASYPVPAELNMKNFSGNKPPATFNGSSHMRSYWRIDSVATAYYNYDILLRYKDPWMGTNANETNLLVAQKNYLTSPWVAHTSSTTIDTFMNYMTASALNGIGQFYTATSTSGTLPVKLFDISAHKIKNDAIVNWTTAQEINTDRFEVERSLEIGHWTLVGKVKAAENSNTFRNYQFTDASAALSMTNTIYYRLKIIDNDGSFTYSKAVSIKLDDELTENVVQVYPNPFTHELILKINSALAAEVKLNMMDISGRIISSEAFQINSGLTLHSSTAVAELQSGMYFIRVEMSWKTETFKVLK